MKFDQAIIFNTIGDIIHNFLEENEKLKPIISRYNSFLEHSTFPVSLYYSIVPIKHPFAYSILRHKSIEDREFINSFIKIKLNWYKRNLALLELLAEKQDLPENQRLVFKIVRENLNQNHILEGIDISEEIEITYWLKAYNTRTLTKKLIRKFFS